MENAGDITWATAFRNLRDVCTGCIQRQHVTRRFAVKAVALAAFMACVGIAAGIKWPPYWWVFTLAVIVWAGALVAPAVLYLGRRVRRRYQGR